MELEATFDPKQVVKYLQQRAQATGRSFGRMMRSEMALMVKVGMLSLPPFVKPGQTSFSGQKAVGAAAVRRDINRVYIRPREVFEEIRDATGDEGAAKAFWKALSGGSYEEAREMIGKYGGAFLSRVSQVGPLDPGQHKWARDKRGRVGKRHLPRAVVTPASGLTSYIRGQVKNVGSEKGGFARAAERLGARGLAAWTKTHGTPGTLEDLADGANNPEITAVNLSQAAGAHDYFLKFGLRNREQRLRRETEAALRRAWR